METIPTGEKTANWVSANLEYERGEIERTIQEFLHLKPTDENVERVMAVLRGAMIVELSDEEWAKLENALDSYLHVRPGYIEDAERITEEYNKHLSPENQRDFNDTLTGFTSGRAMKVPLILENEKGQTHLVSGNTRLMIARALGIRPKVALAKFG